MFKTQGGTSVWLLLGFIFVEMFTMHVYPLLWESHSTSSASGGGVSAVGTTDFASLTLPIQEDGDGPGDHCCVCSCTHMLISEPAYRILLRESPLLFRIQAHVRLPNHTPGALTPPPKFF